MMGIALDWEVAFGWVVTSIISTLSLSPRSYGQLIVSSRERLGFLKRVAPGRPSPLAVDGHTPKTVWGTQIGLDADFKGHRTRWAGKQGQISEESGKGG